VFQAKDSDSDHTEISCQVVHKDGQAEKALVTGALVNVQDQEVEEWLVHSQVPPDRPSQAAVAAVATIILVRVQAAPVAVVAEAVNKLAVLRQQPILVAVVVDPTMLVFQEQAVLV
jgi:hypothetical protein